MLVNYLLHSKSLIFTLRIYTIIVTCICLTSCTNETLSDNNQSHAPTKVALLIPLESQSNHTNTLSINLINGARLAAEDLKHLNLVLSVYPTSGEKARAAHAAEAAVKGGAGIIIGPLFSEETAAVKATLKNNMTKIISLSNDPTVAGQNVFIMGTTLQTLANRLVAFSMSQGFHRIAVVGPEGKIGFNGIRAAEEAINGNGAVLTTISSYPLNFKGIQDSASKVYEELVKSNSTAVIFTDSPTRGLGFISEQLQQLYYNNNKKLPQFMGLTRWDRNQQILHESSLNKGWFIVPDQRFKKKYEERYTETFGNKPSNLSSLSYDAVAMVGAILQKTNSTVKSNIFQKNLFLDRNGFIGINGIFRFNNNGSNERSLSVAEVRKGKFTVIDQAKSKF